MHPCAFDEVFSGGPARAISVELVRCQPFLPCPASCWTPKWANTEADPSDRLGRPVRPVWACGVRVELGIVIWNPFVTQFGRGISSPAYKYKGHGQLRSCYPIESINLHFSYFSPNPNFSNLVMFFARLYGVQGRLEWPADLKTTLDLRAPTGSLPSLRF